MMYVTVPSGCNRRRTASASIPMPIRSSELNISSACCLVRDIEVLRLNSIVAKPAKIIPDGRGVLAKAVIFPKRTCRKNAHHRPSECRDWRGFCNNGLQGLEPQEFRTKILRTKELGASSRFLHVPCASDLRGLSV